MRKTALCFAVVVLFAGFVSMAGEQGEMKAKTHEVTAEILSIDMEKATVTFKTDDSEKTAPVMEEAKAQLEKVKVGDMVVLTCQDTEEGDHEGIVKIKAAEKED
jgi:ribosomal protein S1